MGKVSRRVKQGFLLYAARWLAKRPRWISLGGFIVTSVLAVVNVVIIDPLPFVDEATLIASSVFFGKALYDRKKMRREGRV